MTCSEFQGLLPDLLFDPPAGAGAAKGPANGPVSGEVRKAEVRAEAERHASQCDACRREWSEMRATLELLEEWKAPEPSAYFDARLAARLREEIHSPSPGWLERIRARLAFGTAFRPRLAMAASAAVLVAALAGAGSYVGFESFQGPAAQPTVSATVQDLEVFDANAQTLEELAAFDDSSAAPLPASGRSH